MSGVWYEWPYGANGLPAQRGEMVYEAHIVPEWQRHRHRPQECWCDPDLDLREDGVMRFRHRALLAST